VDLAAVVRRREHPPVGAEDDGADRYVTALRRALGELEGGVHRHCPRCHGVHPARDPLGPGTFYLCACTSPTIRSSPTSSPSCGTRGRSRRPSGSSSTSSSPCWPTRPPGRCRPS